MLVIPVSRVVDPKWIIGKKLRAEEEERHKGSLPPPKKMERNKCNSLAILQCWSHWIYYFVNMCYKFLDARVVSYYLKVWLFGQKLSPRYYKFINNINFIKKYVPKGKV
jgi:hypothetical protein